MCNRWRHRETCLWLHSAYSLELALRMIGEVDSFLQVGLATYHNRQGSVFFDRPVLLSNVNRCDLLRSQTRTRSPMLLPTSTHHPVRDRPIGLAVNDDLSL